MHITTNEEDKNHLICQNRVRDYYRACLIITGLSLYKATCFPLQSILYLLYMSVKEKKCLLLTFHNSFTILWTFAVDW